MAGPALDADYAEPTDGPERITAQIFADVLGLDRVGADDDFFELGGTSLLATDLLVRLSGRLGAELGVADLVEAATPATLAARAAAGTAAPGALVTLQRGGDRRPVFVVPGGTGEGENLFLGATLARRVGAGYPFFGFRLIPGCFRRSGCSPKGTSDSSARSSRTGPTSSSGSASAESWRWRWPESCRTKESRWPSWPCSTRRSRPSGSGCTPFS